MYNSSLFGPGELREHHNTKLAALRDYVQQMPAKELESDDGVVSATLARRFESRLIALLEDEKTVDQSEQNMSGGRDAFTGRSITRQGTRVTVRIPFTGDPILLRYQPSKYRLSNGMQNARVDSNTVVLVGDFVGVPTAADVRAWYTREIETLRWWVEQVRTDAHQHNVNVMMAIPELVKERRARLAALRQLDEELDLDGTG